jgi:hypothetical protein
MELRVCQLLRRSRWKNCAADAVERRGQQQLQSLVSDQCFA